MADDVVMDDMDIDFAEDPEVARLHAAAAALEQQTAENNADAMNGVEEVPEDGEVDSSAPVPTKVHVRGLDNFNTLDVKQFAEENFSMDLFIKVQWVDDTSANIVYDTELAATEALAAFSAEEAGEPLQLRQAKRLSTKPDTELQVRQAIEADAKVKDASKQSRFYLFNPEWDPERRKRKRPHDSGYNRRKYPRRDESDDGLQRRASQDKHFHEDMYDDNPQAPRGGRRDSYASEREFGRRRPRYDEDLMTSRADGRLRNRSASPQREGDGRYGFDDDQPQRRRARARSRTPPGARGGRNNRRARETAPKELFPDRRGSSALTNGQRNGDQRDNYRPSSSGSSRELFPDKLNGGHRRKEAKDLHPDEIADAIGHRPEHNERGGGGRDLFSRISGGPSLDASSGNAGFNIKGRGSVKESQGFSILGASREGKESHAKTRELFPQKAGGGGGDLFDGRIKGRGAQRRRAEDLF